MVPVTFYEIIKLSLITVILALLLFAPLGYCAKVKHLSKAPLTPYEESIIEKIRIYVTSSGKSIGQIIDESANGNMVKIEKDMVSLGEPYWDIKKAGIDKPGYIITCFQGATFYTDGKGGHGDGAITRQWYYDGNTIFAIAPNDLDKNMPVWNQEKHH